MPFDCVDEQVSTPTHDLEYPRAVDVDGDGHLDIVGSNAGDLVLWWGDGTGDFTADVYALSAFDRSAKVFVGELDGVQGLDVVLFQFDEWGTGARLVTVATQVEARVFGPPETLELLEFWDDGASPLALLDVDGDGRDDLAIVDDEYQNTVGNLSVLMNDGTGRFGSPIRSSLDSTCATQAMRTVNFDGGPEEVLVTEPSACFADGLARARVVAFEPNGAVASVAEIPGRPFDLGPATGDLDADGFVDIVVQAGEASQVLLGLGDGSFTPGPTFPGLRVGFIGQIDGLAGEDMSGSLLTDDDAYSPVVLFDPLGAAQLVPTPPLPDPFVFSSASGDFDEDGCLDKLFYYPTDANPDGWLLRRCFATCGATEAIAP